jgi:hypothetical protein
MKRQLCLIVWVAILCIVFANNVPAAEELCNPMVCVMSGGKCVNDKCVKPNGEIIPIATQKTSPNQTPGMINDKCNPLLCLLQQQGKCVNDKCIPNPSNALPANRLVSPLPAESRPPEACNALVCAMQRGECINGVCVPRSTDTLSSMPVAKSPMEVIMPIKANAFNSCMQCHKKSKDPKYTFGKWKDALHKNVGHKKNSCSVCHNLIANITHPIH